MKKYLICLLISILFMVPAKAMSTPRLELENRLADCTEALKVMLTAPDGGIPQDLLRRCQGIVIFPSVLKAGLGVGGHYGKGVALRRNNSRRGWSPPVFVLFIGGSFGWQIGVQSTDLVILIMNEVSLKSLFRDKITIGADASIAAGPVGRDASAGTDLGLSVGMLSYSRAKGLFAGVSIKGSVLEVDWQANESYYGSDLSIIDVVFKGRGRVSPAAHKLMELLNRHTGASRR